MELPREQVTLGLTQIELSLLISENQGLSQRAHAVSVTRNSIMCFEKRIDAHQIPPHGS